MYIIILYTSVYISIAYCKHWLFMYHTRYHLIIDGTWPCHSNGALAAAAAAALQGESHFASDLGVVLPWHHLSSEGTHLPRQQLQQQLLQHLDMLYHVMTCLLESGWRNAILDNTGDIFQSQNMQLCLSTNLFLVAFKSRTGSVGRKASNHTEIWDLAQVANC